jgi:hypothetical protein
MGFGRGRIYLNQPDEAALISKGIKSRALRILRCLRSYTANNSLFEGTSHLE